VNGSRDGFHKPAGEKTAIRSSRCDRPTDRLGKQRTASQSVFQNPLGTAASESQQTQALTHGDLVVPEIAVIGTNSVVSLVSLKTT
jgi:hypothetical protein